MHKGLVVRLAAAAVVVAACSTRAPSSESTPMHITVCGTLTAEGDGTEIGPERLVLVDARSGGRFRILFPEDARESFREALGGEPERALAGASGCATGNLVGEGRLEVSSPADVTIHARP